MTESESAGAPRDDEAVMRFVERFASMLADAGWARMPARVFTTLLVTDSGALTAAELAGKLQVSPAAVSGAVRYLTQLHMVAREREPGTRRDIYRVRNDSWHDVVMGQERMLTQWENSLAEAAALVGPDTPAGRRLTESIEFFMFIQREFAGMMDRWIEHRDALRAKHSGG